MTMTSVNPRAASFIPIDRRDDGHFDRGQLINAVTHLVSHRSLATRPFAEANIADVAIPNSR